MKTKQKNDQRAAAREGGIGQTISIISAVLGILVVVFYCLNWFAYSPGTIVRFGGEEVGNPVTVAPNGRIPFAVSVKSTKQCQILSTAVAFDPKQVDLQAKGTGQELTTDIAFPIALHFDGQPVVTKGVLAGHFFDYSAKTDQFSLTFVTTTKLDDSEIPFPLSMFSARTERLKRVVRFHAVDSTVMDLRHYGLLIKPGESLHESGPQAQEAVSCQAEQGQAQVQTYEIMHDPSDEEKVCR